MNVRIIITIVLILSTVSIMNGQISDNFGDNTRFGQAAGLNFSNSDTLQVSIFGRSAGLNNKGEHNSFFGYSAVRNSTGENNSFFGHDSGYNNSSGENNSFFGSDSGRAYIGGNSNSFFGSETGSKNSSGTSNSFFGRSSGSNNETGGGNSFFGSFSGADNETGNNNSFFGQSSGSNNETGGANSFFGYNSGQAHISGSSNSFFGLGSGQFNTHGARNSFFGTSAGNVMEGSYNVAIGHNSGATSMHADVDSTLYIDVQRTNDPLIYGQFNKRIVRINGSFEAMGGVSNSSDINRKEAIIPIDEMEVLKKVANLELSEWSYKEESTRHLGPMAQDFHKQFGLGKNDTTIGTLDADGVALASIQALYQLWQDEKEVNREQNREVQEYKLEQKKLIQLLLTRIEKLEN